jgi:pilus assembly protein Flp/PilA
MTLCRPIGRRVVQSESFFWLSARQRCGGRLPESSTLPGRAVPASRRVGITAPDNVQGAQMLKCVVATTNFLNARLFRNDKGATAVEYGLIVALIAAVIIVVVTFLGTQIHQAFCTVSNNLAGNGGIGAGKAAGC